MRRDELKNLRRKIKSLEVDLEGMRSQRDKEKYKAQDYRTCLQQILMALGEYGSSLSHKWIGSKIGELLK